MTEHHETAYREIFESKFALGDKVLLDGEIRATVICVKFYAADHPEYEIAWMDGNDLKERFFNEWRLSAL